MPRSSELSDLEKGIIIGYHKCGRSLTDISSDLKYPKSTVAYVIKKWKVSAMGGLLPFIPLMVKKLGFSAGAFGITSLSILIFIPIIKYHVNKGLRVACTNLKRSLFSLIVMSSIACIVVLCVSTPWRAVEIMCQNETHPPTILSYMYSRKCLNEVFEKNPSAQLQFTLCESNTSTPCKGTISIENVSTEASVKLSYSPWFEFNDELNFTCDCLKNDSSLLNTGIISCLETRDSMASTVWNYHKWLFYFLPS
ncbi:major facilitator superfamily domain-containing protein 6 [Caerostris extrusa]|uniref:Major facilitator superfamily domain-containing protein 6 n=1 Tax=Caerostris extrusa TaxID=172846 RepID=A0AAV4XTE5_CAEEX|nr:major facilitator superfamily domain-containing protein 6 [Caerostris extrusa]